MVNLLWQARHFAYNHLADTDTTHPPSVEETAQHFDINNEEAGEIYTKVTVALKATITF